MQKINVPQLESRVFGLRDYPGVDEAALEDDVDPMLLSAADDDRIGDGEEDFDDVLRDFNVALPGEDD